MSTESSKETTADIIKKIRAEADYIEESARGSLKAGETLAGTPFTESDLESALDLAETKRKEADRLEAALKRELSKNVSKNGADFGQLGNAAKLREALQRIYDLTNALDEDCAVDHVEIRDIACAALSAPPRNCDRFATIDEARKAHEEYRGDYIMRASNKFDFPMKFEAWLFAPATEQEGGAK